MNTQTPMPKKPKRSLSEFETALMTTLIKLTKESKQDSEILKSALTDQVNQNKSLQTQVKALETELNQQRQSVATLIEHYKGVEEYLEELIEVINRLPK